MQKMTFGRKAIFIPHSVDVMPLDELASRLASAIHAQEGEAQQASVTSNIESDALWCAHKKTSDVFRRGLIQACGAGQLLARDPVAHMQCHPDAKGAMLLVDDAMRYLAESGASVRITRRPETLAFVGLHHEEVVRWADVAHLVARAMHPETDDDEKEVNGYGLTRLVTVQRLERAQQFGELVVRDLRTRQPLPTPTSDACVTAGDLCNFFEGGRKNGVAAELVTLPEPVTWNGYTYQPPPPLCDEEVEEARRIVEAMHNPEDDVGPITETPFTRSALVKAHLHEWPTIERDISDAAENGLAAAAKAGPRGWFVSKSLEWARSKYKLNTSQKPADPLTQAMSRLPSRTHRMKG